MNVPRPLLIALTVAAVGIAGCGNSATPAPSTASPSTPPVAVASSVAGPSSSPEPSPTTSPSATATPTPTPSPTATPAPTPVPWKTYTSKLNRYRMSYPPDWVVTPGSSKYADQFDNYGYPYVYVDRSTVSGTVSVSLTVSRFISTNKSHYKAKVTSNVALTLANGYKGRLVTFTGVDQGLKVQIQQAFVAKGSVGYFFTLFADATTGQADRQTFRKMYLSWRPTR